MSLPSDREIAKVCADTYAYDGPVAWDWQQEVNSVYVALRRIGDVDVVALRGSTTFTDWVRDLLALANPFEHDDLGPVHPGFYLGMPEVWHEVRAVLRQPVNWVCGGHSLGAGRCTVLTGLAALDGLAPARYVRFGEPRPGFAQLTGILRPIPGASYRAADENGHDLVTSVPFHLPPLEDYEHPQPLTDVVVHPAADDPWVLFKYHHMQGYLSAIPGVTP